MKALVAILLLALLAAGVGSERPAAAGGADMGETVGPFQTWTAGPITVGVSWQFTPFQDYVDVSAQITVLGDTGLGSVRSVTLEVTAAGVTRSARREIAAGERFDTSVFTAPGVPGLDITGLSPDMSVPITYKTTIDLRFAADQVLTDSVTLTTDPPGVSIINVSPGNHTANSLEVRSIFDLDTTPVPSGFTADYYYRWRAQGGSYTVRNRGSRTVSFVIPLSFDAFSIPRLTPDTAYDIQVSLESDFSPSTTVTYRTLRAGGTGPVEPPPTVTAEVAGLTADRRTRTSARLVANLNRAVPNTRVYFRWRQDGATAWTTRSVVTNSGRATQPASGLTAGQSYAAEASTSRFFPRNRTRATTFQTLEPPPVDVTVPLAISNAYEDNVTRTSARLNAALNRADAGARIYWRWRQGTSGSWTTLTSLVGVPSSRIVSRTLPGLTAGESYQFEVSTTSTFTAETTRRDFFATVAPEPVAPEPVAITITDVAVTVPAAPAGRTQASATATLSATPVQSQRVYFRWRRSAATGAYDGTDSTTTTSRSAAVNIDGLTPGTTYTVEASATSDYAQSETAQFTTRDVEIVVTDPLSIAALSFRDLERESVVIVASLGGGAGQQPPGLYAGGVGS